MRYDGRVVWSCPRQKSLMLAFFGAAVRDETTRDWLVERGYAVNGTPATPADVAAFVRARYPAEAKAHDGLVEQALLLDSASWQSRVPAA